jgi:hypothetical protein
VDETGPVTTVTLSLISHTNTGKTALARTLLRRDIGEVRDQPHVTTLSEAHPLAETDGARLLLWDTPGFGDTARLLARLRREADPIGWFLHQVWDRVANRALWCSQEAVRNVRDEADVVLYLVNAAEDPESASYLRHELELLAWMGRPVLVLLNQVGAGGGRDLLARWERHLAPFPIVRGVLSLDAFSRAWVEESLVLERVVDLLAGEKRSAMARLVRVWNARNLGVFGESIQALAEYLSTVAADREPIEFATRTGDSWIPGALLDLGALSPVARRRATRALFDRVQAATQTLMDRLIDLHALSGSSQAQIERRLTDVAVQGHAAINPTTGAIAGGVLSGALSGLGADILSGGLTFGGGAVIGAVLGAVGGYALGGAYRVVAGREPSVRWQPAALDRLAREALLRYLAVAHHGRGRGGYSDLEQPAHWVEAVDRAMSQHRDRLEAAWRDATRGDAASTAEAAAGFRPILDDMLHEVLRRRFPGAAVLGGDGEGTDRTEG